MVSVVPRLAPGSTFAERFRIAQYVGQGSMGSVYRAERLDGGGTVALKLLRLDGAGDPRTLRRFQREAESGARLDSPYIARTLDSGTVGEGGLGWITMEFAEGESFDELLQRRERFSPREALPLLRQVFSALSVAHAAGVVHRDLKPENVRVASQGEVLSVKVLDFGIAKDFGIDTMSGTTPGLGTPLWTAPEQARDGYQPQPSADVWALGLLTFFALTGVPYWLNAKPRASMADLAIELLRSKIVAPSARLRELELDATLPQGFDGWFARAVSRDPAARFREADEAWQALEPLLSPHRSSAQAERRGLVVRRPAALLALVILSCIAMGLTIFWLLRSALI